MSVILGITAFHPGSAACLIVDGTPVFAISEERINRVKYYGGFPTESIRACLNFSGLKISDIDHIAVGRSPSANFREKVKFSLTNVSQAFNFLSMRIQAKSRLNIKDHILKNFDIDPALLKFQTHHIEHHVAHAASSYFISPWEKCASLSVDNSGDFVSTMIADCEGDEIKIVDKVFVPSSLGNLYTMICEFIGYEHYGDEGKVMGLAPYGEDSYSEIFHDMVRFTSTGFNLNQKYFLPFGFDGEIKLDENGEMIPSIHYSNTMVKIFGPPRERHGEYLQRDKDLAFNLQKRFEESYIHMANLAHAKVPSERIVLSGGCALNSVANGKIFDNTPFAETVIQPSAGDEGLSMGAALHVSNAILKEGKRWIMNDAYFGDEFTDEEIQKALDSKGVEYSKLNRQELIDAASGAIADGKVMGWFQGRMEWGPRALGNRSILVHPGHPGMKDILNERIKRREWFRPFAPAVLEERQSDIFEHDHPSPYMLHVFGIRKHWRERIQAVTHVDGTGRLQTVKRSENPLYYDLISAFERRTGIPVLLNTSFNENEPIVRTPDEAIDCYLRTKMDALGIGSFWCSK